ncbi:hypothetical protein TEA_023285 [Camellia sinensis var. sinensis]|uniref:GH18 domain-containing protein n=1 Tax=Camellia sinensis var. sinensis TaxID=542762 RepID=A0A4S4DBL1_CAMSN|nr:hypothetical protein TEA_023285 [Camellia sinensis var. sinensis]
MYHTIAWPHQDAANSKLFREYIGAESDSVNLTNVPINPDVEFHFILAFTIDYTDRSHPSPTNGKFNVFWEPNHLDPTEIVAIKSKHPIVQVAVSVGGDNFVNFFKEQKKNYGGGQVLASFISGGGQGLGPEDGFFEACDELVGEGKLGGIFVWCAVESRGHGFKYEKKSQDSLVSA